MQAPIREPQYLDSGHMATVWSMFFAQVARRLTVTKGTTAQRPKVGPDDIGLMYFDTTLAAGGKPIFYTGSAWVDGLGTVV